MTKKKFDGVPFGEGVVATSNDGNVNKVNQNQEVIQQVRERIAQILDDHFHRELYYEPAEPIIDEILALDSICIKHPDQSKPSNPHVSAKTAKEYGYKRGYFEAQEDMKDWARLISKKESK